MYFSPKTTHRECVETTINTVVNRTLRDDGGSLMAEVYPFLDVFFATVEISDGHMVERGGCTKQEAVKNLYLDVRSEYGITISKQFMTRKDKVNGDHE